MSNRHWRKSQSEDFFIKDSKQKGYRSRSVYRLSEIDKKFGFLLEAFHYGTPPHGGAAIGFDRLLMLMAGESTIRDVIPFPKNTLAGSPLDGSPAAVDTNQLKDLNLNINHQD